MPTATNRSRWYRIENAAAAEAADVYIYDEIGLWGVSASAFVADLRAITAPTIKVHINSPGGSASDGIAIFNSLKSKAAKVHVFVEALAASAASLIAMAGDTISMAPASRMMIHEASSVGYGTADELAAQAEVLRSLNGDIAAIYVERAGGEAADWLQRMADETWYTAQQAVDAGLADDVSRDVTNAVAWKAVAKFDLSKFKHAPKLPVAEQNAVSGTTTVAAQLAACIYDGFTDCVQDLIEDLDITIAEGATITGLLGPLLTSLEDGLGDIGTRVIADDDDDDESDDDDDEMQPMEGMPDAAALRDKQELEAAIASVQLPRR